MYGICNCRATWSSYSTFTSANFKKNNNNNNEMTERLGHFEANINKEIGEFKFGFSKVLTQDFELLNERIEKN